MASTRSSTLLRSVALPLGVTTGLLFLALLMMLVTTARSLTRIQPLRDHLEIIQQVHAQVLAFQSAVVGDPASDERTLNAALLDLRASIGHLAQHPGLLSKAARRQLTDAYDLLATDGSARSRLTAGQALLHQVLAEENRAHANLLAAIHAQAELEMRLAAAALLIIPLAALLVLYLLRRRFLTPLASLNALLVGLAEGHYATARVHDPDPVLEPLIANYNHMVERLADLETEHHDRQARLEEAVRGATRELLAHNRALADAERLAAAGEVAAELAHELRNPLAGIRLALENLAREIADTEACERLHLVGEELRRVTDLMNGLLDRARLRPENPRKVQLAKTCAEVISLARYQTPPDIEFTQDIPADIVCHLPEDRLRQALLNLLLNAAQATGDHGAVRVAAQHVADQLILAVSDTGPGFPASLLAEGIRPFATTRVGGTGLGLASARRLARDLGGELKLENPDSGGARATLRLPCRHQED